MITDSSETLMKLEEQMSRPLADTITVLTTIYCQRVASSPISHKCVSVLSVNSTQEEILHRKLKLGCSPVQVQKEKLWMEGLSGVLLINQSSKSVIKYGLDSTFAQSYSILPGMQVFLVGACVKDTWLASSEPNTICDIYLLPE